MVMLMSKNVTKAQQINELEAQIEFMRAQYPKVSAMRSLSGRDVPNQFIITTYDKTIFQSYNSVIAVKYNDGSVILGEDWDYSATTGKYRNQFLGEGIAETRKKIADGSYTIWHDFDFTDLLNRKPLLRNRKN